MNRTIRLREEADRDLVEAASWYEDQRAGLGHDFLAEALATFRLVAEQPLRYPIARRDMRRALMKRFPFGIYFRSERSQIVVVAVIHASRHPRHWRGRT
jgi:toxin ParE1/3/4